MFNVVLAFNGIKYEKPVQKKGNITIVTDKDKRGPIFFNEVLREHEAILYGFLPEDTKFEHSFVLWNILEKFKQYKDDIGCVYSDYLIEYSHIQSCVHHYLMSYDVFDMQSKAIFAPFFVNHRFFKTTLFNENMKAAYYHDAIMKISQRCLIYHYPEPLLSFPSSEFKHCQTIEKELLQ